MQDYAEHVASREAALLALNQERNALEAEAAHMPTGGRRTRAQLMRRAEVDVRLDEIAAQASKIRLNLKRLGRA